MAGELKINWPITDTLFACVFNVSGKVWWVSGQAFETWGTSDRTADDYDISMTSYTGGIHIGDMDSNIPAGDYTALFYVQSGAAPADVDVADSVANQVLYWTGSIISTEIVGASSITKADILTFVNSRLNRAETDIDESIKIVLADISAFKTLLVEDTSQSLTSSDDYLSYPSDSLMDERAVKSVKLTNSSGYILPPLNPIVDGWQEYLIRMQYSSDVVRSVPLEYVCHANRIYIWPAPDSTYAASVWYYKKHSEDPDDIDFDVDWRNTIYFGVTAEVAIQRKMMDQITIWSTRYEREKSRTRKRKQGM